MQPEEKETLLAEARKSARGWILDKHKERKDFVRKRREEKLREKQEKKEKSEQKEDEKVKNIVEATNSLLRYRGVCIAHHLNR